MTDKIITCDKCSTINNFPIPVPNPPVGVLMKNAACSGCGELFAWEIPA